MNEEINSWLNSGRDYITGVELYEKYGSSATQKRLLRKGGETKRNLDILVYELGKLSKVTHPRISAPKPAPAVKAVAPKIQRADTQPVFVQRVEYKGLRPNTPEVDELVRRVVSLQKIGASMHSTLEMLSSDELRRKAAENIDTIYQEVDSIYERLRIFDKTGSLPPASIKIEKEKKKQASEMDVQQLMQRRSTLMSLISKAKRREQTGVKLETRAKNIQLRERYELELADVNERLRK